MATGTVTFYNATRGYGFLDTDASPEDIFFHVSDMPGIREPTEGDRFEFTITPAERGPRATDLRPVDGA